MLILVAMAIAAAGGDGLLRFDRAHGIDVSIDGKVRKLTAKVGDTVAEAVERFGFGLAPEHQLQLGDQFAASFRARRWSHLLPSAAASESLSPSRHIKRLQATLLLPEGRQFGPLYFDLGDDTRILATGFCADLAAAAAGVLAAEAAEGVHHARTDPNATPDVPGGAECHEKLLVQLSEAMTAEEVSRHQHGLRVWYSQLWQDKILNQLFFKHRRNGVFVDVGASDPVVRTSTTTQSP
jgi:hypothetical protein